MPGKKILVADDSLTIQKVIRLSLTHEGYDIHAVSDGNDALEQISVLRPHLVLIDVSLPGKSAFEVKKEVNALEDLREVRFVLMSGAYEKVDEQQIAEVQFHAKLTKPIDPADLRKILSHTLGAIAHTQPEAAPPLFSETPPSAAPSLVEATPSLGAENLPSPLEQPKTPSLGDDLLDHLSLELPPELQAELQLTEEGQPSFEGLSLEMPPPPLTPESEDLKTPLQPEEDPPLIPAASEPVEKLWETQEEKTLSGLLLNSDLSVQPAAKTPSSPVKMSLDPASASPHPSAAGAPSPHSPASPQNEQWSVRDSQLSTRAKTLFHPEVEPILPTALPEEIQPTPQRLIQNTLNSTPQQAGLEDLLKNSPPLPISAEQIESLVKQQIQSTIEKITQQMLPDIAEKVVKQEIHRLLSEPEHKTDRS